MERPNERVAKGLAGVVVDDTAISEIDGQAGALRYRGYAIEQLATLPFETVVMMLLNGDLPEPADATAFAGQLRANTCLPPAIAEAVLAIAAVATHPMLALQASAPLLLGDTGAAATSPGVPRSAQQADDAKANHLGFVLAARLPAALALILRGRAAWPDVTDAPDRRTATEEPYGALVLRLLTGQAPSPEAARAFEQTQILQMEHGFNAGTFTARVVASTLAPVQSAVSAAIGALYGPLHGGADQAAIEMARAIGDPAAVPAALQAMSVRGEKVMGMGHREYRVIDPRSRVIEGIAERIARPGAGAEELAILKAVAEATAGQSGRTLHPNIEFYKGVVFLALGLAPNSFTCCFAIARVWGYIAHYAECQLHNRILRPAAAYVGPAARAVA